MVIAVQKIEDSITRHMQQQQDEILAALGKESYAPIHPASGDDGLAAAIYDSFDELDDLSMKNNNEKREGESIIQDSKATKI